MDNLNIRSGLVFRISDAKCINKGNNSSAFVFLLICKLILLLCLNLSMHLFLLIRPSLLSIYLCVGEHARVCMCKCVCLCKHIHTQPAYDKHILWLLYLRTYQAYSGISEYSLHFNDLCNMTYMHFIYMTVNIVVMIIVFYSVCKTCKLRTL